MRLGNTEERRANLVDQAKNSLAIGVARQHPIQAEQIGAQRFRIDLQHTNQLRRKIIEPFGEQQGTGQHLLRTCRGRLDFNPQARHLKRNVQTTRGAGDFYRARQNLRIAGAQRQIGICLARQIRVAALQGNFSEQYLEDALPDRICFIRITGAHFTDRRGSGFLFDDCRLARLFDRRLTRQS